LTAQRDRANPTAMPQCIVAMPFELKAGISSDIVRQVEYWFSQFYAPVYRLAADLEDATPRREQTHNRPSRDRLKRHPLRAGREPDQPATHLAGGAEADGVVRNQPVWSRVVNRWQVDSALRHRLTRTLPP